jgi:aspartyl-tRNA(Asn)/glutamyl-tRNA(Gln) amidotransferase subunit A
MKAHELSDRISKKEIGIKEIVDAYYRRIDNVEEKTGSFISLCRESALIDAEEVQKKIDTGEIKNPIAGIPFAVKDNMCIKGSPTTCASKILENFKPPYNATVIEKLKKSGAIVLGKANLDEFAMGGSTENSFYQKTTNPWNSDMVPGGSSGGSAASVAAGEVCCSLGSDTGGSIRQPASFCGVTGLKPTYGLVSRYGLVAFASSLDQIGPIAKDVQDIALVLQSIAGHDSRDSTSANVEVPDYSKALVDDIKGMKIGIPKEYITEGINDEVKQSIMDSIKKFEELGARVEEFSIPETEYAIPAYYLISSAEASSNLARYDGIKYGYRAEKYDSLLDLYKNTRSEGFGTEVKRRIMLGTYALSSGYYDAYYKKALQVRTLIMDEFNSAFEKYDLIMGPTAPTTAYKIGEKSDNPLEMYLGDIYTVSVNIAGLPAISVPCGFDKNNLPVGMQLIGKPFDEMTILRAAYSFESNTDFNRMPKIEVTDK